MQTENQGEKLRLESIANIVQTADVESQIAYRQSTGELNAAQAAVLRAQQPHVATKILAEIEANKALTAERNQARVRSEKLTPAEIKTEEARARASNAAAAASDFQVRRGEQLLQFEKDRITAEINRDNAAAGTAAANEKRINELFPLERDELKKKIAQYVDVEITTPGGGKQTGTVPMNNLLNEINDSRAKLAQRIKDHEALKRQARQDDAKALETSTKAENQIKQRKPGGYAMIKDDTELTPDADLFHATSKNPYLYILESEPGSVYGSTPRYKKRDLPKVDGHQYTAREIYDLAEERSMTVQQYMEQVFYSKLQQPVPWNSAVTSTLSTTTK